MPFGTVTLNDSKKVRSPTGTGSIYKHNDVTQIVHQALEAGLSHIDTAACNLARCELYITTKYSTGGDVHEAIRKILWKLRLDYVDLYLIHGPSILTDTTWKEFEAIKENGLSKSIGVSNFTLEELQQLINTALVRPAINQIEFHPYNYARQKALVEWSSQNGIVTAAYSTLSSITKFAGGPVDAPIAEVAKRLASSPAQVILSWARAKGVIIVTTTGSKERLSEYLAVADLPPLTEAEIAAIDDAGAKGSGYCQDREYRRVPFGLGSYSFFVQSFRATVGVTQAPSGLPSKH
ncbi:Aldo/keto reductase [Mycena crocata]|nr:Aldo/keto reductase [Mycena crocata]